MTDHLTYHQRFSPDEFETQYNLRLGRPDYEETVIPDWMQRSEAARANLSSKLDIRYGEGEKQKLDVFNCGDTKAATIKIAPAKPEVFNVSRSKRLQGRCAASRLATKVAE